MQYVLALDDATMNFTNVDNPLRGLAHKTWQSLGWDERRDLWNALIEEDRLCREEWDRHMTLAEASQFIAFGYWDLA